MMTQNTHSTNMKYLKFIFILFFFPILVSQAQIRRDSTTVNDLFEKFISHKLSLTREESMQMKPLVKKYIFQRKRLIRAYPDPLEREKQIINLKLNFRDQFSSVIGQQRANGFFIYEQSFRHKIKEELKQRRSGKKF